MNCNDLEKVAKQKELGACNLNEPHHRRVLPCFHVIINFKIVVNKSMLQKF